MVQGMIQSLAKLLDRSCSGLGRCVRQGAEAPPRQLEQAVVPEHNDGDLQDVAEDILTLGAATKEGVQGVRKRHCHIRVKRPELLGDRFYIVPVRKYEAANVQLENSGAHSAQFLRHLGGKIEVHATEPVERRTRRDNAESRQGQIQCSERGFAWCVGEAAV